MAKSTVMSVSGVVYGRVIAVACYIVVFVVTCVVTVDKVCPLF